MPGSARGLAEEVRTPGPYAEEDVSILIPTYQRKEFTLCAVKAALGTGAGEVIVSDNGSTDGTAEALGRIHDPRLRVLVQARNLGLWPNHRALLALATCTWAKFLHADDTIEPTGLGQMIREARPATAVVAALPVYVEPETGRRYEVFSLSRVLRWSSDAYLKRMLVVGNELGTPTCTLLRRSALDLGPSAWDEDKSCDLLANIRAASRGEVVLVPAGPVTTTVHEAQDGQTQGLTMAIARMRNTVLHLKASPDARVRRLGRVLALVETGGLVRGALGHLCRRGRMPFADWCLLLWSLAAWSTPALIADAPSVVRMLQWKFGKRDGRPLDAGGYSLGTRGGIGSSCR